MFDYAFSNSGWWIIPALALLFIIAHAIVITTIRSKVRTNPTNLHLPFQGLFWVLTILVGVAWAVGAWVVLLLEALILYPPSY